MITDMNQLEQREYQDYINTVLIPAQTPLRDVTKHS